MEANQQELVDKFTGVTGVDADRAKFYLESSGWMLDVNIFRYIFKCVRPVAISSLVMSP